MTRAWAILTGEYPPAIGGVADHAQILARGLAAAGDRVHVFAPAAGERDAQRDAQRDVPRDSGVVVHELSGGFGFEGLGALDHLLSTSLPRGRRELLVEYTPQAFGARGMNVGLCAWLRSREEPVTTVFHEVAYPIAAGQPLRHNLLGAAHRLTARLLCAASARVFVSTTAWERVLRDECGARCAIGWLSVPSNLPVTADPARVDALRRRFAPAGPLLLGHFGTYGPLVAPLLGAVAIGLLRHDPSWRVLLVGAGSAQFRARLLESHPGAADRLFASGTCDARATTEHVAACDALVQPYPDGVTTRRSSLMAGMALGRAVLTNLGPLSEDMWRAGGDAAAAVMAVEPVSSSSSSAGRAVDIATAIVASADALTDAGLRARFGEAASALYRRRFAPEHAIAKLRGDGRTGSGQLDA